MKCRVQVLNACCCFSRGREGLHLILLWIQDCESLHKNKPAGKVWDLSANVYSGQLCIKQTVNSDRWWMVHTSCAPFTVYHNLSLVWDLGIKKVWNKTSPDNAMALFFYLQWNIFSVIEYFFLFTLSLLHPWRVFGAVITPNRCFINTLTCHSAAVLPLWGVTKHLIFYSVYSSLFQCDCTSIWLLQSYIIWNCSSSQYRTSMVLVLSWARDSVCVGGGG